MKANTSEPQSVKTRKSDTKKRIGFLESCVPSSNGEDRADIEEELSNLYKELKSYEKED